MKRIKLTPDDDEDEENTCTAVHGRTDQGMAPPNIEGSGKCVCNMQQWKAGQLTPDRVSNPGQPVRKARALPLSHQGVLGKLVNG